MAIFAKVSEVAHMPLVELMIFFNSSLLLSFREGRFVIADIILTYDKYLISSYSVVNNLYMLHRHGFIQNLKIQGDVSYDKCMLSI